MTITVGTVFTFEANAVNGVAIARLDSTRSIVIWTDGSDVDIEVIIIKDDETLGASLTLDTGPSATNDAVAIAALSSTKALAGWRGSGTQTMRFVVLSISGTTITMPGSILDIGLLDSPQNPAITALSPTRAVAAFRSTGNGRAHALKISDFTVTSTDFETTVGGLKNNLVTLTSTKALWYQIHGTDGELAVIEVVSGNLTIGAIKVMGSNDDNAKLDFISSTRALVSYNDTVDADGVAVVADISGTTVTLNTIFVWKNTQITWGAMFGFSINRFVVAFGNQFLNNGSFCQQLNVSGTTVSTEGSNIKFKNGLIGSKTSGAIFSSIKGIFVYNDSGDAFIVDLTAINEYDIAPMRKPADIDADGTFIYIAALDDSGFPVLLKLSTAINADATTVFEPLAGDDIGVQCGRFNADIVWVAGAFDDTNTVEKSEDAGTLFAIKDDGTFGDVKAFIVGPGSDDRVLIADDNVNIEETLDSGTIWTNINTATGFNVNAIARLDINVEEVIFGNDASASDNIDYSVNSGVDMEDFTTGDFPTDADVTSVIVND